MRVPDPRQQSSPTSIVCTTRASTIRRTTYLSDSASEDLSNVTSVCASIQANESTLVDLAEDVHAVGRDPRQRKRLIVAPNRNRDVGGRHRIANRFRDARRATAAGDHECERGRPGHGAPRTISAAPLIGSGGAGRAAGVDRGLGGVRDAGDEAAGDRGERR